MTPQDAYRIRRIWDEIEQAGDLRGDPWTKIRTVAPQIETEIGPHITFRDIAEAAGSRADDINVVLDNLDRSLAQSRS